MRWNDGNRIQLVAHSLSWSFETLESNLESVQWAIGGVKKREEKDSALSRWYGFASGQTCETQGGTLLVREGYTPSSQQSIRCQKASAGKWEILRERIDVSLNSVWN